LIVRPVLGVVVVLGVGVVVVLGVPDVAVGGCAPVWVGADGVVVVCALLGSRNAAKAALNNVIFVRFFIISFSLNMEFPTISFPDSSGGRCG
jgi:hypothetical protein